MIVTRIGPSCWKRIGLWICLGLASGSLPDHGGASQPYTPSSPDPVLESWRWRSFPELKGMGLRCMAEDKDGNMWFGVDDGVRCYDGVRWTAYTPEDGLLGAPVKVLLAMRDGSLYAGTDKGITRFSEGVWRCAFPLEGDLSWGISDLMETSDGSVWAGTWSGALHLDREGSTLYTTEQIGAALRMIAPYVRLSIVPDERVPAPPWPEGIGIVASPTTSDEMVIWVMALGGPGEAVGLKVGDRITVVDGQSNVTQERLNGPTGSSVKLTVQREGHPEPFEVTVTRKQVEGTYRDFRIWDVYEDQEGAMWFGLFSGEILRYNIHRDKSDDVSLWRLYTKEDGLDMGFQPHIVQTRDGAIWAISGHSVKGVNRFDGEVWTKFRLSHLGGDNYNYAILETQDGTLWIGGKGHLHVLRDKAGNRAGGRDRIGVFGRGASRKPSDGWMVYRTPDVPISPVRIVGLLEASDGAFWVAGRGQEVVRLDYGTSRWTTYEGLNFQCETSDGAQWFLAQDNGVVRYDRVGRRSSESSGRGHGRRRLNDSQDRSSLPNPSESSGAGTWTHYGVEDGLMDAPVVLMTTRKGDLWAAGSHDTTAAIARFDGGRWSLETHPRLSWGIVEVYESWDGARWFGANESIPERGHLEGVLRFYGNTRTHYPPPDAPWGTISGIGQTADGALWVGGTRSLRRFDGQTWIPITEPKEFTTAFIHVVHTSPSGDLWVGTQAYGAFYYDGKTWTRYDVRDGLADTRVSSILQTDDGSVWVATTKGISRFDRRNWTTQALPSDLPVDRLGSLRQSRDGAIWINRVSGYWWQASYGLRTVRYEPDAAPPETKITLSLENVSQPGNTILAWQGIDPWRATPEEELQYAYRLDEGEWSPFSPAKNDIFQSMPSGQHIFEVKARDRDFNEDPTPAALRFTVVPPVWRQLWFIGLMVVVAGIIAFQASRIVVGRRDTTRYSSL